MFAGRRILRRAAQRLGITNLGLLCADAAAAVYVAIRDRLRHPWIHSSVVATGRRPSAVEPLQVVVVLLAFDGARDEMHAACPKRQVGDLRHQL